MRKVFSTWDIVNFIMGLINIGAFGFTVGKGDMNLTPLFVGIFIILMSLKDYISLKNP